MGDLKPLGSEKLQGMDKIKRMLEISKFKENIPQPINETSKDQYRITLADGNEYQIVREKTGYIIKKTISESVAEYIDPIKHRKYYPSYSQALKRLNLMAKETNTLFENEEGISLFEQKKFVLKTPKPAAPPPPQDEVENVPPPPPPPPAGDMGAGAPPPPPPSDMGAETPPPPPTEDEGDMPPPPPEEGEEDMGMNQGEMDTEGEDEVVTFKSIQKLVGRLGQKLRTIASDEENKMSSKDIKYVVNSILSALNLDELDEDDREQIINKFEGIEDEESMGAEEDMSTDETGMEGEESSVPPPPPPAEEMGEMTENDGHDDISMIADNLFKEHKVEQLLYKYFVKGDNEKRVQKTINEEKQRKITQKNKFIVSEIKRLSESVSQEVSARKLIQQYPKLRFVGKSNKNNLVFENSSLNQFKVTPNGKLI
jgi:hypothetical protein